MTKDIEYIPTVYKVHNKSQRERRKQYTENYAVTKNGRKYQWKENYQGLFLFTSFFPKSILLLCFFFFFFWCISLFSHLPISIDLHEPV